MPVLRRSRPWPLMTERGAGGVRRMTARLVTLLPEPDSPTSASVSRWRSEKETSLTTKSGPPRVAKPTLSFSTVSAAASDTASAAPAPCGLMIEPGIEGIAQPVAEEVKARHRRRDHEAGKDREPRRRCQILLSIVEHVAPACHRRLDAVAEKADVRFHEDRARHGKPRGRR